MATRIANSITNKDLESLKIYYIFQALSLYSDAYFYGSGLEEKWKKGIEGNVETLWKAIELILIYSDSKEKVEYIEEMTSKMNPNFHKLHFLTSFVLAQSYYNLAVTALGKKDLTNASKDINFAKSRFERYLQTRELVKNSVPVAQQPLQNDHEELEIGIRDLAMRIEASTLIKMGDFALDKALNSQAGLEMEYAFNSIDCYHQALQAAEEKLKEDELIAECKAKYGRVLLKVLKNEEKASIILAEAINLVHKPENVHLITKQWHINCKLDLQQVQVNKDDVQVQNKNKFKDQLDLIEKQYKKKDYAGFLLYLQANHMTNNWKKANKPLLDEDFLPEKLQRTYVRIIKHYHPDKSEQSDGAVELFYTEITQYLNLILTELREKQ